ncbi:hypothetical protein O7606_06840 [Micromonospora sp. WMMD882]|uniref:hypothetical protein n=1 Tax=Micromonospora sp. WMMD882 TaxID=3015151 RepID=UPI00248B665E|nr:hypothetical protein [Micromonospora sp. WMMD882]WBB81093.1 hypothetical protein O7606_06840 [Micromonospora sp. WMMD882]
MTQPTLPTGARILAQAHPGVCGIWWRASTPDGVEQLALRIASTDPDLARRLTATTEAVGALRHGGLLTTGAPIRHNGALWLVADRVPGPTLSALAEADGAGLDAGAVATIAAEIARTLSALHTVGIGHGAVHGRTVTVSGIGAVTLTETGLLPGLRHVPADPAVDRRAWAELLRWLVARWCGKEPGSDLLLRCAARGEHDLAGAVRELRDGPLPVGAGAQTTLVAAVTAGQRPVARPDAPTVAVLASTEVTHRVAEEPTTVLPSDTPTTAMSMSIPTDPFRSTSMSTALEPDGPPHSGPGRAPAEPDPQVTAAPTAYPGPTGRYQPITAQERTSVFPTAHEPTGPFPTAQEPTGPFPDTAGHEPAGRGRPVTVGRSPTRSGEVRFGPGVPPATPAAPVWPAASPPAGPRRSRWRLAGSVLSTLLTLALLVAVGLHLWQRMSPLEIHSVRVAVPEPPGDRCDVTVDVVATVETNGRAGAIRYQWLRSDAEPGGLLTERVARGQRTATLHLKWAFSGVGATTETAVVNITEPTPTQGRAIFRYQCAAR